MTILKYHVTSSHDGSIRRLSWSFKIIAAEGEMNASKSLKQAADIIGLQPAALQLRYSKPYFRHKIIFCQKFIFEKLRNIGSVDDVGQAYSWKG